MRVLVAFATSRGSTRGIAEGLATRLQHQGVEAEAVPVTEGPDIASYDAVVLGSAIHGGKWLEDAARFATQNQRLLRERPVWLFSVSTVGNEESMFPPRVAKKLRAMRKETSEIAALRRAIHSRGHRDFAGVVSRGDWPASGRAFFRAMGGRYGDHRNWPAIDGWADDIAAALASTTSVGPDLVSG